MGVTRKKYGNVRGEKMGLHPDNQQKGKGVCGEIAVFIV